MLDHLPNENALQVLWHLSKSDLLVCLTVNQRLYQLVIPILYRTVSSSDVSRITQGLQFLCDNPAIAQHVRSVKLRIEQGCDGVDKLSLVPQVLTNLHELHVNADYQLSASTQTALRCQRTLQSLSVQELGVSFAVGLLQSGTFTSLTCLHISFLEDFWAGGALTNLSGQANQGMIEMGRKVISCFAHLPALTVLSIKHAKFDLNDMEQLHSNLPELKVLTLINNCIPAVTTILPANGFGIRPSVKLESLHLTLTPDLSKMNFLGQIVRALAEWLPYMKRKYTKLTALAMEITDSDGNEFDTNNLIPNDTYNAAETIVQELVSKLDGLEKISALMFPFTEANVELCNKHELQAVGLFDCDTDIRTQIRNLHNSKQKNSIRFVSLALYNIADYNNVDALRNIFYQHSFDQLTRIDIRTVLGKKFTGIEYRFSLYLLQYVPSLQVLNIYSVDVIDRKIPALPSNRLKTLNITRFYIFQNWKASNKYLEFILQASPHLETFSTTLKIGYRSRQYRFVLDLTGNKQLKSVYLGYFSSDTCLLLEHDPKRTEKYWKTLTKSIKKPSRLSTYALIDLRWNETTKVDAYPVPPSGHR